MTHLKHEISPFYVELLSSASIFKMTGAQQFESELLCFNASLFHDERVSLCSEICADLDDWEYSQSCRLILIDQNGPDNPSLRMVLIKDESTFLLFHKYTVRITKGFRSNQVAGHDGTSWTCILYMIKHWFFLTSSWRLQPTAKWPVVTHLPQHYGDLQWPAELQTSTASRWIVASCDFHKQTADNLVKCGKVPFQSAYNSFSRLFQYKTTILRHKKLMFYLCVRFQNDKKRTATRSFPVLCSKQIC